MRKHNLAFIDIETTGLDVMRHEIIQIGCVIVAPNMEIIEEFELKIKPEHIENADKIALKVNKYNEEDWAFAYTLPEALKILSEKVKNCIMVGQNVSFDSAFLEYNFLKTKVENTFHYHKLDTISMAWEKFHGDETFEHFSLREMCKYFGIINENVHTGLSDARATFELYKKLLSL
ncbi:MAG: 3'-5' exonuclease [Candidatus Nomurabacteria bacterium]|nr:3'-5' exonuclease [Candidatus Nomurabacteria bacterium]